MQFEGALIREQGVTFGVIAAKPHVSSSPSAQQDLIAFGHSVWGPVPIVLVLRESGGRVKYIGEGRNLVNSLAKVHPSRIPWKRYTVRAA